MGKRKKTLADERGYENLLNLFAAAEPEQRGPTERGQRHQAGFGNRIIRIILSGKSRANPAFRAGLEGFRRWLRVDKKPASSRIRSRARNASPADSNPVADGL
jgi:hypothetical protein